MWLSYRKTTPDSFSRDTDEDTRFATANLASQLLRAWELIPILGFLGKTPYDGSLLKGKYIIYIIQNFGLHKSYFYKHFHHICTIFGYLFQRQLLSPEVLIYDFYVENYIIGHIFPDT